MKEIFEKFTNSFLHRFHREPTPYECFKFGREVEWAARANAYNDSLHNGGYEKAADDIFTTICEDPSVWYNE